ncbi:MAG: 2-C-methyl-D-erythritol 4-phosphate cytidylyltransferase [Bacteroidales bacterium]|nr:2-C-methyl-D-erythritol 4-phosphate cytidylyltransferase [Bacteroidales bacterium]MCF8352452.1 2-C-methyl-D-erythritol 4-phosphate cytidylyltransferase [Bacteroidales bacterium]MCF8375902.1 2-C-methyl-D-erythritol 4-phosphate cytidylyltransferase [Bacteroidales bacterium]
MKNYLIIVAGGTGKRMQSDIPKQFIRVAGMPVLYHSLKRFQGLFENLHTVLVLPAQHISKWKELCIDLNINIPHQLVAGGKQRFESVKAGLSLLPDEDGLVAIHDGVRPLVAVELIKNAFQTAAEKGNAIPAIKVPESIRQLKGGNSTAVNRDYYRLIQTPQVFRINLIKKAYLQPYRESFTDDASVLESMGDKIHLIEGNPQNIKITNKSDLNIFEALLK